MRPAPDPLQEVLDNTRQRFVASFASQCDSIRLLVETVGELGTRGPVAALLQVVHRMSGLAGTIGFPTISVRASTLEHLIRSVDGGTFDVRQASAAVDAIVEAFATDLANPPAWAVQAPAAPDVRGAKILVAEDESDQRAIVTACLEGAGYVPITVVSGDLVVETARAEKPALILLDIALPKLDGYSACRRLKADPELAGIPVIFMTTGGNLDDRLAGLTLGADEFLSKPLDMRELVLRIQRLLGTARPHTLPAAHEFPASRELTYDAFLAAAHEEIARPPAALAIVRLPAARHAEASLLLTEELRVRDGIGAYGPTRLLVLMPEMTAVAARERLEPLLDRLVANGNGICAGLSATSGQNGTVAGLIGEADEALAEARYLGHRIVLWTERADRPPVPAAVRTVVVAEDDPDVTRIVDAQLRAGGYKVTLAFDGEQTLAAVRARAPDALVLDLMMPKLDGFEVLRQIREGPEPRPKIIVLSGRGREQDVMRAFESGADDYMTKPFNPQELMARIARLLR